LLLMVYGLWESNGVPIPLVLLRAAIGLGLAGLLFWGLLRTRRNVK
jgi:hypothetical protein